MSTTPPPVPATPLQYQTPVSMETAASVVRQGPLLITPTTAVLPDLCVKCCQPGDGRPIRKKFQWHPPLIALLILINLLLYLIVALIMSKKATVTYSLCPLHRKKRNTHALIATAICLVSVPLFFVAYNVGSRSDAFPLLLIGGILTLLAGLIYGIVVVPPLKPKQIDKQFARIKGCGPDFLSQFPAIQ